jgi:hypothetical protein
VSAARLAGSGLIGLGVGAMTLATVRGDLAHMASTFLLGTAVFLLLTHSRQRLHRFPSTDLERGLDRLFALLLPTPKTTTTATVRRAIAQQTRLAGLRHGVRLWAKELQLITTDGYETASRISALSMQTGEHDDRALVAEAVRVLGEERASAGANLTLANDPISILAYGLGARPARADLTSLDDLLTDLGLAGQDDELRTHFDDILAAESSNSNLHLRNSADRRMFRDLAGASFVLGASARILEIASFIPQRHIDLGSGSQPVLSTPGGSSFSLRRTCMPQSRPGSWTRLTRRFPESSSAPPYSAGLLGITTAAVVRGRTRRTGRSR